MIIDPAIREQPNIVQRQMMAVTEIDRLRELLRTRLTECGWREQVTVLCRKVIAESNVHEITIDDVVDKVTPQGRALVPDTIKKELLQKIKNHLMEEGRLLESSQGRAHRHR